MNIKLILCIPLFLLIIGCKTQNTKPETSDGPIIIMQNSAEKIPNSKITLTFRNIVEDSRCPADATCIWEGIAIVNLTAKYGNETQNFQIATRDFAPKNALKSFEYKGYTFTLEDVNPKPGGKKQEAFISIHYKKN